MGVVTSYTAEHIQELIDVTVVGASFVDGELILELTNGDLVNAGPVKIKSPNGTSHKILVANDGTLSTVVVT